MNMATEAFAKIYCVSNAPVICTSNVYPETVNTITVSVQIEQVEYHFSEMKGDVGMSRYE